MTRLALSLLFCLGLSPAFALDLPVNAVETARATDDAAVFSLPLTAFDAADPRAAEVTGTRVRRAFRIAGTALTPFQMIDRLRREAEAEGFTVDFACADTLCGGFDFRYALDLLPEPAMHVDIGNYQYLVARHDDGRAMALVTSRARSAGFVHVTEILPTGVSPQVAAPRAAVPAPSADIVATLKAQGHVALEDLSFVSGASDLGEGPFASLATLAAFLKSDPEAMVVLVGHTDNVGSQAANQALSERRAAAVRARLIEVFGVSPDQLAASGVGFLAPRVSNATKEGRETNRRVEAVLAPTR